MLRSIFLTRMAISIYLFDLSGGLDTSFFFFFFFFIFFFNFLKEDKGPFGMCV